MEGEVKQFARVFVTLIQIGLLYKIGMRPCNKQLLFEPTGPSPSESFTLDIEEGIETVRASIYLFTEKVVFFARLYADDWVSDIKLLTP